MAISWDHTAHSSSSLALNRRSFLSIILDDHQLFFNGGNFQMIRAKKWVLMSTHHISITYSPLFYENVIHYWLGSLIQFQPYQRIMLNIIELMLWWNCDANMIRIFFLLHHIIVTFLSQWRENVFSLNVVINMWFTFPSHFHHNVKKMCRLTFCDENVM